MRRFDIGFTSKIVNCLSSFSEQSPATVQIGLQIRVMRGRLQKAKPVYLRHE